MLLSLLNQTIPPKEIHLIYDKNYIMDNWNIDNYFACNNRIWSLSLWTTIIKETESIKKWISYTRNKWISELTHDSWEFIFFCDDDDIWYPQKTQAQLEYILNNWNVWIIWTNFREIDAKWNLIRKSHYPLTKDEIYSYYHCPFKTSTVMMERHILLQTAGFDTRFNASEDTDFFYRVLRQFPHLAYNNLATVLLDYRTYTENMSHKIWFQQRVNNLKIYNHYFFPQNTHQIIPYTKWLLKKTLALACTPLLRKLYLQATHKHPTPLPNPSIDLWEAQHPQTSTEQ
jgi:glycosyltransferase involved in cell wall biosynthesis